MEGVRRLYLRITESRSWITYMASEQQGLTDNCKNGVHCRYQQGREHVWQTQHQALVREVGPLQLDVLECVECEKHRYKME